MPKTKNRADDWLDRLRNHPIIAAIVVASVILAGVASFTESIQKLAAFVTPKDKQAPRLTEQHSARPAGAEPTPPPVSSPAPARPAGLVRESSAGELSHYLRSLPPVQREGIVKTHYLNHSVSWTGRFSDLAASDASGFLLLVHDSTEPWVSIGLSLDIAWASTLDNLRRGDLIAFEGTITEARPMDYFVNGTSINLLPRRETTKQDTRNGS